MGKKTSLASKIAIALGITTAATAAILIPWCSNKSPSSNHQQAAYVTFEQALNSPQLRQTYLNQLAKEFELSPDVAKLVYDPEKKLFREGLKTIQYHDITLTLNNENNTYRLKIESRPFTPDEIANYSFSSGHGESALVTAYDRLLFAQRKPASIHVFERIFSGMLEDPPEGKRLQTELLEIHFRSSIKHEILHAKDYHSGFSINEKLIDNDMSLVLDTTKLLPLILEARAYGMQIIDQASQTNQVSTACIIQYKSYVKEIEQLRQSFPAEIGQHNMHQLIDDFLKQQYQDQLLNWVLKQK